MLNSVNAPAPQSVIGSIVFESPNEQAIEWPKRVRVNALVRYPARRIGTG